MATDSEIYNKQLAALCANRCTTAIAEFLCDLAAKVRELDRKVAALQAEREEPSP